MTDTRSPVTFKTSFTTREPKLASFVVSVEFHVQATSAQQAEAFVRAAAVDPFKFSRRGSGRIVRSAEQKESEK